MKAYQVWYESGGGDEQYTPKESVEILLPHIQHLKDKIIWLPFDREDSQFVKVLSENGFKVTYSHIDYDQDFFKYEPEKWDLIISNPPYHNKRAYWERCCDLKKPFLLFLPVNILSDSVINTLKERGRENELCMLIPDKRTKFYNATTGETGKNPTFKAVYIGLNVFKNKIILENLPSQNARSIAEKGSKNDD